MKPEQKTTTSKIDVTNSGACPHGHSFGKDSGEFDDDCCDCSVSSECDKAWNAMMETNKPSSVKGYSFIR